MPLFLGLGDVLAGAFGLGDVLGLGAGAADIGLGAGAADVAATEAAPLFAGSAADFLAAPAADVAAGADVGGAFGLTDAGLAGLGSEGAAALGGAGTGVAADALTGTGIQDALVGGVQQADLASTAEGLGSLDQIAMLGNNALGTASDVGGASGLGGLGLSGAGGGTPAIVAGGGPAIVPASAELPGAAGTGGLTDPFTIASGVGGNTPQSFGSLAPGGGQNFGAFGAEPGFAAPTVAAPAAAGSTAGAAGAAGDAVVPGAAAAAKGAAGSGGLFGTGISGNTALLAGAGLTPLAIAMMRGEQPLPQQANQIQSQLATPLSQFSQQQLAEYQANQVNPAQKASLDAMRTQLTNQWRQTLMNQGVTVPENDTRWPQIQAQIDQQVMQSQGQMLANNLQGAFTASGQAGQDLANLANLQVQQDQAYQQAINQATQAAGMVIGLGAASGKLF